MTMITLTVAVLRTKQSNIEQHIQVEVPHTIGVLKGRDQLRAVEKILGDNYIVRRIVGQQPKGG